MQERYLGRIEPDMDVCDINGAKIGSVARVYRYDLAQVGSGTGTPARPEPDEIVEVKTGFLGFGKHLYLPLQVVQEVTEGCVFLSKSRDDFDEPRWQEKPAYLNELS